MRETVTPGLLVLGLLLILQMGCRSQSEDLPPGPALHQQTPISPQFPPPQQLFGAEAEAIAHPGS